MYHPSLCKNKTADYRATTCSRLSRGAAVLADAGAGVRQVHERRIQAAAHARGRARPGLPSLQTLWLQNWRPAGAADTVPVGQPRGSATPAWRHWRPQAQRYPAAAAYPAAAKYPAAAALPQLPARGANSSSASTLTALRSAAAVPLRLRRLSGPPLRALQVLDVSGNDLTPASLVALPGALQADSLPQLAELHLAGSRFDNAHSGSALARAATHALRVLNLRAYALRSPMYEAPTGAALPALTTLRLDWNPWHMTSGGPIFAGAPWAAHLRTLGLSYHCSWHDELVDMLQSIPRLDVLVTGRGLGGAPGLDDSEEADTPHFV